LPLFDAGGEAGEILADAQDPGLDHRDHRGRQFDPGLGNQGLDQQQQQLAEAVCYRGKGGSVVHTIKLVWMMGAGQAEKTAWLLSDPFTPPPLVGGLGRGGATWGRSGEARPGATADRRSPHIRPADVS
jgi:hypothetical protein